MYEKINERVEKQGGFYKTYSAVFSFIVKMASLQHFRFVIFKSGKYML